jgi:NitT/TauT family transport system substrate-binding protein
MSLRTRVAAGLLATALGAALAACGEDGGGKAQADANGVVTVRIAHNSNAAVLPVRVAAAQGFFKKHGINAQFTQVEDTATLPPALGKSFDVVLSAPTLEITASAHHIPMRVISGATVDTKENPTVSVIASGASGVTDISQLNGKNFGSLSPTGTSGIAADLWMKKSGVDLDKVNIFLVTGPQQVDQMKAGRVDAVVTVAPFSSQLMALPGSKNLGDPYLQMAPRISGINWASSRDWAASNPQTVKNFTAAVDDAIAWIGTHDAEARKVLQSYTQLPDQAIASLKLPTYESAVRQSDLDRWLDAMKEAGDFQGDVDTSQLVDKK